jgi:hypothetical protein
MRKNHEKKDPCGHFGFFVYRQYIGTGDPVLCALDQTQAIR